MTRYAKCFTVRNFVPKFGIFIKIFDMMSQYVISLAAFLASVVIPFQNFLSPIFVVLAKTKGITAYIFTFPMGGLFTSRAWPTALTFEENRGKEFSSATLTTEVLGSEPKSKGGFINHLAAIGAIRLNLIFSRSVHTFSAAIPGFSAATIAQPVAFGFTLCANVGGTTMKAK